MKNIAVFFGGKSVEHDVSIVTGLQLMENLNREKFNPVPIYITREGDWFTGPALIKIESFRPFNKNLHTRCYLPANARGKELYRFTPKKGLFRAEEPVICRLDAAIPAMHGLNGEDGTLQGLLELCCLPYTSCGVLGSAAGMDKILMKAAFRGAGLPVLDAVHFDRDEFANRQEELLQRAEALGYPLFVKPANLGSSIGISRAQNQQELVTAIEVASHYDRRIMVEKGVAEPMEINCSALGFGARVRASVCEMPVAWQDFLTYEDKYLRGGKGGKGGKSGGKAGMASLTRQIPAPIPEELSQRIQALTLEAFRLLDCKGVVRVDYLYDKSSGLLYINEINTIPGSFAFYLWENELPYPALLEELIRLAEEAAADRARNQYAFGSAILSAAAGAKRSK